MSKTGQNNTCQSVQMKGSESVKYKARKHFLYIKKKSICIYSYYPTTRLSAVTHSKL